MCFIHLENSELHAKWYMLIKENKVEQKMIYIKMQVRFEWPCLNSVVPCVKNHHYLYAGGEMPGDCSGGCTSQTGPEVKDLKEEVGAHNINWIRR